MSDASLRSSVFESSFGTIANGGVYLAKSNVFKVEQRSATKYRLRTRRTMKKSSSNLGLFASIAFQQFEYITCYGGEHYNRSLKEFDSSVYVMKIDRHHYVDGRTWADLIDRSKTSLINGQQCYQYFNWPSLPSYLKHRYSNEIQYESKIQSMLNSGCGLFANQSSVFIPNFARSVDVILNESRPAKRRQSEQAKLVQLGINCILVPVRPPNSDPNEPEQVVLQAITDIQPNSELITYYGSTSREQYNRFFN